MRIFLCVEAEMEKGHEVLFDEFFSFFSSKNMDEEGT
jgi:hypothetical protein